MVRRLFYFLVTLLVLLSACTDNDSFSADPSRRLTFSTDTVRLDTLFSTVPSSTYTFWVYNHSGDGLRIQTVRLERGNQSGFRVNVDGTYLNPAAANLELRSDDSLRVFVEITARENLSAEAQLVEDNLLFTLESGAEQRVNLRTYSWDAEKLDGLTVEADMTIESEKPVVVYGEGIYVGKDATLTLKNTTLYFHDGAGIQVEGQLIAENCLLRGDRLDHMFDYLPYDRVSGQWSGIYALPKTAVCRLENCEIRNAYDGLYCDSTSVTLVNTVIHNCRGYALYAHDSEVTIDGCLLSNTLNDCLAVIGGQTVIDHTTLAQFYPLSADRGAAIRFGHTERPLQLICRNMLATGYGDDVLLGEASQDDVVQYSFENCLLRTPQIDDGEAFKDILWEKGSDEFQGKMHFVLVDEVNLLYDFRIKPESPAYEKGIGRIVEESKE